VIGSTTIDRVLRDGLEEDWGEYLVEVGIDPEAAGLACGQLAHSGVVSLNPRATREFDPMAVGSAMTTAALCGFELGVRTALELAKADEPCGHDGWTAGCVRCEVNMALAEKAMGA
jgi:hypothetical protein